MGIFKSIFIVNQQENWELTLKKTGEKSQPLGRDFNKIRNQA